MWPQITYLTLTALGLGFALANDGKPRTPYSFGSSLFATALSIGLLWAGGFFSVFS